HYMPGSLFPSIVAIVFSCKAVRETALGMEAPRSIGSQRSLLFHGGPLLRSGGRLHLHTHRHSRPQRDDQGESKEHQSQHGVESSKEWNVCADGRKDFCLDKIDTKLEPDETFLPRWESSQVRQNNKEKGQNSKRVTNIPMSAPI